MIATMTAKKTKPASGDKPKKPRVRKGKALNVWINGGVRERLSKRCKLEQRNLNVVVERALEMYLATDAGIVADKTD